MPHHVREIDLEGRILKLETGKLARLADASIVATMADTTILASVMSTTARPGIDFFPLTVDYRERPSAAGKFPGGFHKREGRPSTKETLTMRNIDRPIRPSFPKEFRDEVLIQTLTLSADGQTESDIIAMNAAMCAMLLSSTPFLGPLAAVRIAKRDGKLILMPTAAELEYAELDLLLAGHPDAINMIEVGAKQVPDDEIIAAMEWGHGYIKKLCEAMLELKAVCGKPCTWTPPAKPEKLLKQLHTKLDGPLTEARTTIAGKKERNEKIKEITSKVLSDLFPDPEKPLTGAVVAPLEKLDYSAVKGMITEISEDITRKLICEKKVRPDGRGPEQIRDIECEAAVLPRVHGSSLFTRGETQALCTVTLGTTSDEQIVDGLGDEYATKFLLHYNFPPLATGEVRRIIGLSRREIGHGALAERSVEPILPSPEDFPYTVRVVSDILESNGSSSMATVCGACLALMDAGVPIASPVAGISIGMVTPDQETEDGYVLLTDILGEEDHFGDMDFKIAGTVNGVTGIQLDLKRRGLSWSIIRETFERARKARLHILEKMTAVLPAPRADISQWAPRLLSTRIDPEKIGKVIGPGGKGIKGIEERTGAKVEIQDDGTVFVSSIYAERAKAALAEVEAIGMEIKVGMVFTGRVVGIKDFGAFVELAPGTDGLLHISELSEGYIKNVTDVLNLGDTVRVKVILIDDSGRIKLSRKILLEEEGGAPESEAAPIED